MFAGVLAIATWPLFERLRRSLGGNSTLAATVMLVMILVLVIIPITLLSAAAADKLPLAVGHRQGLDQGRIARTRAAEEDPDDRRTGLCRAGVAADRPRATGRAAAARASSPPAKLSLAFVRVLGDGILQLLLVAFVVFFYYRDGDRIVAIVRRVSDRLSGRLSAEVMTIVTGTTRSVFIGIVGTAAAQAVVALIGFLIAGVPAAFMLAVATFVLSVVPMGPVLIWGARGRSGSTCRARPAGRSSW